MDNLNTFIISLTMVMLFSIAIIGFAIGFANDNDSAISISSDPDAVSVYNLQKGNVSNFRENSETTYTSLLNSTIEPGSETIPSPAPFSLTGGDLINGLTNIITLPIKTIFGGWDSPFAIFFTAITAVLGIMLIFFVWKAFRGNP